MTYFVYILRCNDNSLYCGITNNLNKRIKEHNFTDKGAKYTRIRRPVSLVYFENKINKSDALKREFEIKKNSKAKKEEMVRGFVQQ